jgi:class 3 adenylate cyclase/tetratricopeptide (TPR) repeat protein
VCSVLFCDLVGFTPLSETRDPEDVRELLSRYFEVARTIVGRHGGLVEKFIGDAVMAVWGTPTATEGDAERAVRAALELVEAVAALGREVGAVDLAARAGVVTGSVAVTMGARGEGMVAGDPVNTAARVQSAASPGEVLVDDGTQRVTEAAVQFVSAGDHLLKGKSGPVRLWRAERVLSGVGGSQRIDGLEARCVGRDTELRLVKELFHACVDRRSPRLVSVTGAAGVGKSRLGWEFEKYIDGLAATVWWHRGRCLSYGEGVAFWALAEMVRQRLQIAEEDSSAVAAEKLTAGLEGWLTDLDERAYVGPRLAQLLGVDYRVPGPTLGRDELFAGWRLFFERLADQAPVVMVVEDLHFADAGLLDFLEHLLDWARDAPVFVLTLARPELEARRAGWGHGRRNTTTLSLDPLDDASLDALLDGLVPGMPASAKAAIAARAEGVPLYAVETVRMLIDRDIVQPRDGLYRLVGDVGELAVPASLQSLLAARLDTLDPHARRLVADAAVLGGSFPAEALIAVSDQPEQQVRRLLGELVRREVLGVRADPLSPQRGHYGFVQTMFRQVAYDTLSRRERKARHLAVAAHLQTAFADGGEEIAEVIAAHLIDALRAVPDDPDVPDLQLQAVAMLTRAGERAGRAGAPAAAAGAYTAAAELLAQQGMPSSDLAAAALHERAADSAGSSGDQNAALSHYEIAATLYRRHDRLRDVARAEKGMGATLRRQGRLVDARVRITAALAVLRAEPDADTVAALAELATLEAFAGNSAEAERGSAAALAEAQALDLPDAVLSGLLSIRGVAHGMASRPVQAIANLREAVRRAESAQDSAAAARALLNLADQLISIDAPAAVEATRASLAHCRRIGFRYVMRFGAANLIHALLLTGDWDSARQAYATAVDEDELGDGLAVAQSGAVLHALSGDRGRLAGTLDVVERSDSEDPQDLANSATAMAVAAALGGDHAHAFRHAMEALRHGEALGLRNDAVRWAWSIGVDAALAMGELADAKRLLGWLDGHPAGHIPPVLRAERLRLVARCRAAEAEPATAAFDAAVKALRDVCSPFHLAVGLLDHAEHLAATTDPRRARELAVEAQAIARELGAGPLSERAAGLVRGELSAQLAR